ncbi:MAG: hypothetical protein ACXABO_05235, partial [Promethearchaeota archaeon]
MRFGTQIKKLHKRIKSEKKYHPNFINNTVDEKLHMEPKKTRSKETKEENPLEMLEFLRRLLIMINDGATGFDLAYAVEKNQEVKKIIYDGILFYNTFIEIGNQKFIEVPDKVKKDYRSFKTIEDTEKYIFMVWLRERISSIEKKIKPLE